MDEQQLQKIIFELQNGNERQRRASSYKLSKSKSPLAVPALIHAYNDSDSSVRQNVIDGLRAIGTQEAINFLNSHNIQSVKVGHKNAGTGCSPEAKAILAGLVALMVVFAMGVIIMVAVDTATGKRVGDSWLTILGVVAIGAMYWVYGLVRGRRSKMPTQLIDTTPSIPENVIKGSKQMESQERELVSTEKKTAQTVEKVVGIAVHPIGKGIKAAIHIVSICGPAIVLLLPYIQENQASLSVNVLFMGFLFFAVCVTFFYFLAGGFDWQSEKLSTTRRNLFYFLSGILFGLIFYVYWKIVRWVFARIFDIPFEGIKGKLLTL